MSQRTSERESEQGAAHSAVGMGRHISRLCLKFLCTRPGLESRAKRDTSAPTFVARQRMAFAPHAAPTVAGKAVGACVGREPRRRRSPGSCVCACVFVSVRSCVCVGVCTVGAPSLFWLTLLVASSVNADIPELAARLDQPTLAAMAKLADARQIVKKKVSTFLRFHFEQFDRMNPAWRKP